ncbi:hypothetical protein DV515_00015337 [Chloebia gouldiae]|uniref:Uncharacterized protein n=1 Tax=Chloebia gouldiae TaxID=44316 RepID=A0A3L8RX28_CHLGU|nr:hypothetical protein DV515_00015337 [Chloebia gouldiae]
MRLVPTVAVDVIFTALEPRLSTVESRWLLCTGECDRKYTLNCRRREPITAIRICSKDKSISALLDWEIQAQFLGEMEGMGT